MTAVLLGLIIAAAFGTGDFVGGRASVQYKTSSVLVVSQACSLVGAVVLAALVAAEVTPHDYAYGAAAGAVNVVGLGLLYQALARYPAGVVAPIAAVVGSAVPVTWGFVDGERPSALVIAGLALAIIAGAVIAHGPTRGTGGGLAAGALQATISGLLLGSSLVLFAQTSEDSGLWPIVAARLVALVFVVVAVVYLTTRSSVPFPRGSARKLAIAAGVFDVCATALLIVAIRQELMVVVAPLAALAPAFTVVLAAALTEERLDRVQRAGLALALVGLVLIAAG